jgi:phytoene synthase
LSTDVFARCAADVRRHDPERFIAALFAPEEPRKGLFALYAFNLEIARVRERVREPAIGEMRLQWWHDTLDQIFAGRPPRHDVSEALARTVEAAALPRAPFDALIEARRFDLYNVPMESEQALASYARATASGLAQLATQVLSGEALSPALLEATDAGGRAFAYTGVLRALPIHAARGQLYLPMNRIAAMQGEAESVFARQTSTALAESIGALARAARRALEECRAAYSEAREPRALPAFVMLAVLPPILARLARTGFDPFRDSAELSPLHRFIRLTAAGLRGRF